MIKPRIAVKTPRTAPQGPSGRATPAKASEKPWAALFIDYGYTAKGIPSSPPPTSGEYADWLDWVADGMWIDVREENLAMDLWMGRVDPFNYSPRPKQDSTPRPAAAAQPKQSGPAATGGAPRKAKTPFSKSKKKAPELTGPGM